MCFVNLVEGAKVDRDSVTAVVDSVGVAGCGIPGTDIKGGVGHRFRVGLVSRVCSGNINGGDEMSHFGCSKGSDYLTIMGGCKD